MRHVFKQFEEYLLKCIKPNQCNTRLFRVMYVSKENVFLFSFRLKAAYYVDS